VFDVFEGSQAEAQIGKGQKSVAVAVRLQPLDRTLTDAEIEAISLKIQTAVVSATGGALRA
jgi:phenylalanyl-tRNA synthetase beta chain